jgi:hypothetical protein
VIETMLDVGVLDVTLAAVGDAGFGARRAGLVDEDPYAEGVVLSAS